jgi:hypothetical protein
LAPIAFNCFAKVISFEVDMVETSGSIGGKSMSPDLTFNITYTKNQHQQHYPQQSTNTLMMTKALN